MGSRLDLMGKGPITMVITLTLSLTLTLTPTLNTNPNPNPHPNPNPKGLLASGMAIGVSYGLASLFVKNNLVISVRHLVITPTSSSPCVT